MGRRLGGNTQGETQKPALPITVHVLTELPVSEDRLSLGRTPLDRVHSAVTRKQKGPTSSEKRGILGKKLKWEAVSVVFLFSDFFSPPFSLCSLTVRQ